MKVLSLLREIFFLISFILIFIGNTIRSPFRLPPTIKKPSTKRIKSKKPKRKKTQKVSLTPKISHTVFRAYRVSLKLICSGYVVLKAYAWQAVKFIHAISGQLRGLGRYSVRFTQNILSALSSRVPSLPTPQEGQKPRKPAKSVTIYELPFSVRHARIITILAFITGSILTLMFFLVPYVIIQWIRTLPSPYLISSRAIDVTTKIYDRNGILLYEIYADQNRTPVPLDEIPAHVKHATIAIEDQDFYNHQGFSFRGIMRALRENLTNNTLQGGSTITQQLVKTSLLTPEIKLSRKIKEIVLAYWAEQIYSKDQILEMYLNQVPFGGTAWGIEAASQMYFGKSVRNISLSEAALLASLPAAPTKFSPFGTNLDETITRQHEVLRRMAEEGYITKIEAEVAAQEQLKFMPPKIPIKAPHFVLYVKELLESQFGARLVERGGLRITTSLDSLLQEKMEAIVAKHIASLTSLHVGNGAAVVTRPKTGEILAMVGSKNYFDTENDGNVNVTTRLRQPGSSIKVVNYAAALDNGFTAATVLNDAPVVYTVAGSEPYAPRNYDGRFHGPVPLRYALGNSYNVPAVRVLDVIGIPTMLTKARAMGIQSWNNDIYYGLSLTLGGADVTMLDMATAYGTLANIGKRVDLTPVLEITDYTGQLIYRARPQPNTEAVSAQSAWIIGNILSDNVARAAAFGPKSLLVIPGKTVSVKTGTSNDKRDNWTIGYTPSYVVAVWVGNNDNSPMDPVLTSGITGATPIWHDMMEEILKDKPDELLPMPEDIVSVPCYFGRTEYFKRGTEPQEGKCLPLPMPTRQKSDGEND